MEIYTSSTIPRRKTRKIIVRKFRTSRVIGLLLVFVLLISSNIGYANTVNTPKITINSHALSFSGVEIRNNRAIIPLRGLFETLGAQVSWDNRQGKITISRGSQIAEMHIGRRTALINGESVTLEVAPYISRNRAMVPVRVVEQVLGTYIDWDAGAFTINLWDENFVGKEVAADIIAKTRPAPTVRNTPAVSASNSPTTASPAPSGSHSQTAPAAPVVLGNGARYVGDMADGKFHGNGKLTWPDGSYYDGMWRDGLFHGNGTYRYADGSSYVGDFAHGKQNGLGVYKYADGTSIYGLWKDGRCIEKF